MKESLVAGITYEHRFVLPETKTVPNLYPEAEEFQAMPEVFATGYLVGFLEWACIMAIKPHIDWPHEQSLGTHIDVSHEAATPPGLEVVAKVRVTEVVGQRVRFEVRADDGVDVISRGWHERFVISKSRFDAGVERKREG